MPELPEVETLRAQLERELVGKRIVSCRVLLARLVAHPSPTAYRKGLTGKRVFAVRRRGKYLLFNLGKAGEIVFHLGMTGSLLLSQPGNKHPRHTHLTFRLSDGRELLYVDPRTFGITALVPRGDYRALPGLAGMGPEPLEDDFTPERLAQKLRGRCRLKAALLDQSRIAGLGNIYADEALHRASLHPLKRLDELGPRDAERLCFAIREVLEEALAEGGSSVNDYVDLRGNRGGFQERHRVYRRAGQPCPRCGTAIERERVAGRSTYFCPRCQG